MTEKKKPTKRSRVKNAALKKQYNSKIRQEYLDYDYLKGKKNVKGRLDTIEIEHNGETLIIEDTTEATSRPMTEEELEWLNNFTAEYNNANFKHAGELIDKRGGKESGAWDRNNARNRCLLGTLKAQGRTIQVSDKNLQNRIEAHQHAESPEDAIIEAIDAGIELTE